MPTKTFGVVGLYQEPNTFIEYVLERFPKRTLHINAARIDQDDLSQRRDDVEYIEFEMKIEELLSPPDMIIVSGTRIKTDSNQSDPDQWIRVVADLKRGAVTFDILD